MNFSNNFHCTVRLVVMIIVYRIFYHYYWNIALFILRYLEVIAYLNGNVRYSQIKRKETRNRLAWTFNPADSSPQLGVIFLEY